jgi:hypothetical protein
LSERSGTDSGVYRINYPMSNLGTILSEPECITTKNQIESEKSEHNGKRILITGGD